MRVQTMNVLRTLRITLAFGIGIVGVYIGKNILNYDPNAVAWGLLVGVSAALALEVMHAMSEGK